jgi:hypothetical protein
MERQYESIRRLLARVRSRYRAVEVSRAVSRAAWSTAATLGLAVVATVVVSAAARSPWVFVAIAVIALMASAAAIVWAVLPLRRHPSDRSLARFVEERVSSLDDRLATAVDVVESGQLQRAGLLGAPLIADAARRAEAVDVDQVVAPSKVRHSRLHAVGAAAALVVVLILARAPARQSLDAASFVLFPAHVTLEVSPGNTRLRQGATLSVEARLAGSGAPVTARLDIADVADAAPWRTSDMTADAAGRFHAAIPAVERDLRYRVTVGAHASPVYRVRVAQPPRVVSIDVDYVYPAALGIPSRTETDAGDVYAPAGTEVRLHVHAAQPVATGRLSLSSGASIPLVPQSPTELIAPMKISADGSYRVALVDSEGLGNDAGTEYFVRVVADRPPDVHISKPASDRQVTALEEVDVEAQADDDYGLDRVELVYAVRGEGEKAVALSIPKQATTATVRHTIYLEDLGVRPGDFVSYYVRARDVTHGVPGARSNEGRSDIFFLEVRPFEQEFSLAESQSMAGSGYNGSIDDLVNAQKQIVVATWKIDRRTQSSKGAQSPADVRAIGRSESDLLTRVEEVASSLSESTMRDPRRRLGRSGDPSMPEEQAMTKAVEAMGRAMTALDALKTSAALPPEMQALNALLEAQSLVKKRQISRQQTAQGGPGNNNRNYDVSTLFDKELQRLQETNYESRQSSGRPRQDAVADKLKALARRQDELLRREQQLQNMSAEERARELEKLTREQAALRQEAEELTKSASKNSSSPDATSQLRDVARDMEGATNDLRRQDANSSQSRGRQALDKLQRMANADRDDKQEAQRGSATDPQSQRLQDTLARAHELQQKLDSLTRELQQLGTQGRGQSTERTRLQQEAARQLQQTRELIEQLRREDPSLATGGPGFTYEGQGMTFSAPGTEAFKQDLSRWETLRDQATRALDRVTANVSQRLAQKTPTTSRAAAGLDDKPPAAYRAQVDAYFKAIAAKKAQ